MNPLLRGKWLHFPYSITHNQHIRLYTSQFSDDTYALPRQYAGFQKAASILTIVVTIVVMSPPWFWLTACLTAALVLPHGAYWIVCFSEEKPLFDITMPDDSVNSVKWI